MNFNIQYHWAMPNHQTFLIPPIKKYLENELITPYQQYILDPFANRKHKFATVTNDLDKTKETHFNLNAIDFLNLYADNTIDVILFDPPYSLRQLKECYNSIGQSLTQHDTIKFFTDIKNLIAQKLAPGGKCYSFGWNSVGLGKSRGFTKAELLLICHGGNHNDTIILKEIKTQTNLTPYIISKNEEIDQQSISNSSALQSKAGELNNNKKNNQGGSQ